MNDAEIDYIEAGGGGEYKGERVRSAGATSAGCSVIARSRRLDRAVRRQLHAGLLRHLVPDVPRDRARHGLHQRRDDDHAALHRRVGRRAGGGQVSDRLLKRTGSANLARKLPIVGGMLLASTIVAANYVPATTAGRGHHVAGVLRPGHDEPRLDRDLGRGAQELIGLTAGIFNFSANLAGIVTPLVIGYAYQSTGIVRRAAGLHRRRGAGRRVLVQRDPRRHPPPRPDS